MMQDPVSQERAFGRMEYCQINIYRTRVPEHQVIVFLSLNLGRSGALVGDVASFPFFLVNGALSNASWHRFEPPLL